VAKRYHNVPDLDGDLTPQGGPGDSKSLGADGGEEVGTSPMFLGDSELELFDLWARESTAISGTKIKYYSQDQSNSTYDPVYGEPISMSYRGPFELDAFVAYPTSTAETREEGAAIEWRCDMWVARAEWEDRSVPVPIEGDIVEFWDIPFFDKFSMGKGDPNFGGYFFDVIQVSDDGHLFDGAAFVGFTFQLKRYTAMTPERKLFQQGTEGACP